MTSTFSWKHVSESDFNRLAENLVMRKYQDEPGLTAFSPDGRGGDEGLDIAVAVNRTKQIIRVYQLKFFPEGFSGGHSRRREQIEGSLATALLKHSPDHWILVVPAKVTVSERKYLTGLARKNHVRISVVGSNELDLLISSYKDVADWVMRNPLREALEIAGNEQAALAKPGDLAEQVRNLGVRADAQSLYWGQNFSRDGDQQIITLYPKHALAAEKEPLTVSFTAKFGPDDAETADAFQSIVKFGANQQVTLQPHQVTSFETAGNPFFASKSESVEVTLGPALAPSLNQPITLKTYRDSVWKSSHVGVITYFAPGTTGATLETTLSGGSKMTWTMPKLSTHSGSVQLFAKIVGQDVASARKSVNLIEALREADQFELRTAGAEMFRANGIGVFTEPVPAELSELIDDLTVLEEKLPVAFRVPEYSLSDDDRIWIRIARRLLQGVGSVSPNHLGFSGTLNGTLDDAVRKILSGPSYVSYPLDEFPVEILGQKVPIGDLRIVSRETVIEDAESHLARLEAEPGVQQAIHGKALHDEVLIMTSAMMIDGGTIESWGLDGIDEHPAYLRLEKADSEHHVPVEVTPDEATRRRLTPEDK